jgi:membrane fusion protein (multidrug efflux system)
VAALPAPPRRGVPRAFVVLGVVTVVGTAAVLIRSHFTAGEEDTDNAMIEGDVVAIASRVAGPIVKVYVKTDQAVKKGDPILEIDPSDFQTKVAQAEAELERAKSQALAADAQARVVEASAKGGLSSAKAAVSGTSLGVGSAEAQIAASKAAVLRAETDARRAKLDLERTKELRAANAVPQEKLDNAQLAYDSSQAALELANAQLVASNEGKHVAESRVDEARGRLDQSAPINFQIAVARANAALAHAGVKSAAAVLAMAENQLSYTHVVAPADGFVSKLNANDGQLVQPGTPLAELVPQDTYVVANFKETQIGGMHPGDRVEVRVDSYPGHTFEGVLTSLSGGTGARFSLLPPDNASGNFVKVVQRVPVHIAWKSTPEMPMRAGLSAEVTVHSAVTR